MDCTTHYLPYEQTGYFSKIVLDYIQGDDKLKQFYNTPVSLAGVESLLNQRKKFNTHRTLLVNELQKQYNSVFTSTTVNRNIEKLLNENTFTITTAHQPNIFTGHLYFIYKIIHAIKLANQLNEQYPNHYFVPVFYMGSEDADLDELGKIHLNNETILWNTKQTGAVGRMLVDDELIKLIEVIEGQLAVLEFGSEMISLLKKCYSKGATIQQATFQLIHSLFADFGLVVLLPDNEALKKSFIPIVKKELEEQFSHPLVEQTNKELSKHYKVQASGRNINLFYLINDKRERIEKTVNGFEVKAINKQWTETSLLFELNNHPERFSPNVILRGVFQELILPNIIFIGGGGELAYWLELKSVFENVLVPFPMLVLRNSILFVEKERVKKINKFEWSTSSLFNSTQQLIEQEVKKLSSNDLSVQKEKEELKLVYEKLKTKSAAIDASLVKHIEALHKKACNKITALEKKLLKAEKKKYEIVQRQIVHLKQTLFPGGLQERVENFLPYYAKYGKDFIQTVYQHSLGLEQEFLVLFEKEI